MSGGVSPFNYSWSTSATTEDISGISSGNYSVNVTDANGCPFTDSFVITQLAPVVLASSSVDPLCFGDSNGSIDLSVNGGAAPYTYTWSNVSGVCSFSSTTSPRTTATIVSPIPSGVFPDYTSTGVIRLTVSDGTNSATADFTWGLDFTPDPGPVGGA